MKIKIIYNETKPWARKIAERLTSLLKKDHQLVKKKAEITIVIGGDGTILFHKDKIEGSVLAIGSEKSSICQLRQTQYARQLDRYLKNGRPEERITLLLKIGGMQKGWAINDISINSHHHNMLFIEGKAGERCFSFEGDGLIISTPTGSTAYAFSAGGVVMERSMDAIELVPLAPYKRAAYPFIISGRNAVDVIVKGNADIVLDGQKVFPLKPGQKITIIKGKPIRFLEIR